MIRWIPSNSSNRFIDYLISQQYQSSASKKPMLLFFAPHQSGMEKFDDSGADPVALVVRHNQQYFRSDNIAYHRFDHRIWENPHASR